jgi:outer membrane receptor protein involved in Fe transport
MRHSHTLSRRPRSGHRPLAVLLSLSTALAWPTLAVAQDQDAAPDAPTTADEIEPAADVSIPGGDTIIVTGRISRDPERASTQVVSVLSSEQIARTGEGDIAGALGRVTGLSVQGAGYVYVRGLGDRYSLALLNGLPLPSPQPLSRVVPLDIFPTNIVASSLVQKTYSANFPGEFGGGVINLTTRAIPDESFLTVSGGLSGDTETTFQNGLGYYGSDFDWFGFDDGTRDIPDALQTFFDSGLRLTDTAVNQQTIAKQLGDPNLILLQKLGEVPANFSAGITGGTATDVFDDGRLGVVATVSLNNKWRTRNIRSQSVLADFTLNSDFVDTVTDNRILLNGLVGVGLEVGDHVIRWTNLFIRDSVKLASLSQGTDFNDDDDIQRQQTSWQERQLMNSQLVAELEFGDLGVDLRGGYARTEREAPYEYTFTYVRENSTSEFGDDFINVLDRQTGDASVVFSNLKEDLWYGGIDISYPLADWLSGTVGYSYTDTARYSERREFLFNADNSFPDGVGMLRPDLLLGDAIIDFYRIGLIESTESDPAFNAGLTVHGGYAKAQVEPLDGVSLDIGMRYEDGEQFVEPAQVFTDPSNSGASTYIAEDYWLPGATLTWEVMPELQLRANASRTVARPQFRELIFQTYYDPETNRQYNGNPYLVDSELTNFELRGEYYVSRGSRFSLAGFYKSIDNPIEAFSSFSDNEQLTRFANAPSATLYGGEFDAQYTFDLADMGGFFATKELVLFANYTWTQSEISVSADDVTRVYPSADAPATNFFRDGVPLTGQSDHLANFQLSLEDTERLQQFTVLLNYASERVTSRGTAGLPDIVENPGLTLDLVFRQGFTFRGSDVELKMEARNITGRDNFEYQSNGTDRIEINSYDVGTSFSASLSFTF